MTIRFKEDSVRPMGLPSMGVLGIKLAEDDQVAGAVVLPSAGQILLVASDGHAKRLTLEQFPLQGRYGQGVQAWKLPKQVSLVGIAAGKENTQTILILDKLSPKSLRFDEAPLQTRTGRGKVVQELKGSAKITRLVVPWEVNWSPESARRSNRSRTSERGRK